MFDSPRGSGTLRGYERPAVLTAAAVATRFLPSRFAL
jgi:hypothetical protein